MPAKKNSVGANLAEYTATSGKQQETETDKQTLAAAVLRQVKEKAKGKEMASRVRYSSLQLSLVYIIWYTLLSH